MIFAYALIILTVGSVAFHLWSPWYLPPLASNWGNIDDTIALTFWVTGAVFIAINLFMAWCVIKYRARPGHKAHYEPENKKLEWWLTGITSLGVVAMLAPGLWVWADFVTPPEGAAEFEAVGQQWSWSFRFPGKDGKLGNVASRFVSDDNPFGMNPEDPNGQDDVLVESPEVHLPVNVPVIAWLRSKDVLHDFAVPHFRVKMDLVPGHVTYQWFEPTVPGRYMILCEELCGIGHHTMRGHVVVEEQSAYDAWLASWPTYAETLAQVAGDAAAGQQAYAACGGCHGAQGEGNRALNAPKLSGQEGWYMARQLKYFKEGTRGAHADDVFGQMMAPMAAMLADDTAINNVVAYIETLPDSLTPRTVVGDLDAGKRFFKNCTVCHGSGAMGIKATHAPRVAGMSDWYLVTQLKNFKQKVRGAHPADMHGEQMGLMADILPDDQAINDIVAYINTLPPMKVAHTE